MVMQQPVQQHVFVDPIFEKGAFQATLVARSGSVQYPGRGFVAPEALPGNAVQLELDKAVLEHRADRFASIAAIAMLRANPVPQVSAVMGR